MIVYCNLVQHLTLTIRSDEFQYDRKDDFDFGKTISTSHSAVNRKKKHPNTTFVNTALLCAPWSSNPEPHDRKPRLAKDERLTVRRTNEEDECHTQEDAKLKEGWMSYPGWVSYKPEGRIFLLPYVAYQLQNLNTDKMSLSRIKIWTEIVCFSPNNDA